MPGRAPRSRVFAIEASWCFPDYRPADVATVGDTLGFANPVFDAQNTKQVGTDNGACWRTAVGKSWECVWTLMLADGQITVEGPYLDAGDSVLAITGGTGVYQTARGQMTLHARDANGSAYDFAYEIVK